MKFKLLILFVLTTLVEWFASEQVVQEIQSILSLVVRNHVSSIVNHHVCKALVVSDTSCRLSSNVPCHIGSLDPLVLSAPWHLIQKGRCSVEVANEIIVSVVEDDWVELKERYNIISVGVFEISVFHGGIDVIVACFPGDVHTQVSHDGGLVQVISDGIKVIAERRRIALSADIIVVDVSCKLKDETKGI